MRNLSLVLLPGLDGTGRLFKPFLDSLPDWITPIVVSYPTDQPRGYEDLIALVSSSLPAEGDYLILGESFSGPLAVMAAARKPKGLRGIVLCASFVRNPFRLLPSWAGALSVGPIYELWPATIRLRAILASDEYKDLAELALDAIKSVNPDVIAKRVKAILTVDVQQTLASLDVPILYLAGRKDRLIRKHNVTGIKAIKPSLKIAELDTRHFVLQLEAKQSAAEIELFASSIGCGEVKNEPGKC